MPGIDLHTHSTASDGTMSPSELLQAAKDAGLEAIALTDHDTIDFPAYFHRLLFDPRCRKILMLGRSYSKA